MLEANILMSCTGSNHTLEQAYAVATNFENTLQTISQGNRGMVAPNMASMFGLPQLLAMSHETPQLSALTSYQERTNERLDALETASKKSELDVAEVKASLDEVRDGVKSIKEELVNGRFGRPVYQRQVRPLYPMSRMPFNSYNRPFYQGSQGFRPRVTPGLTGGPGYVNQQGSQQTQNPVAPQQRLFDPNQSSSTQMNRDKDQTSPLALPQRPPGPQLSAVEDKQGSSEDSRRADHANWANPNLQSGCFDTGFGWTTTDFNDAAMCGYDMAPEGAYVFSDMPF